MLGSLYENDENTQFQTGELVYVTSGEYSDYSVSFIARVLKPFDARAFTTKTTYAERLDTARLLTEGVLEELPARELDSGG